MYTYKAAMLHGKKDLRFKSLTMSPPSKGEVVVRIKHASFCPTDMKKYLDVNGKVTEILERKGPYILGHEASGVILSVGDSNSSYSVGDPVVVLPIIPCGECGYCKSGTPEYCNSLVGIGGSAGSIEDCVDLYLEKGYGGCYGELLKLPETQVVAVPEGLDLSLARLMEPVADVVYSVEKTGDGFFSTALIIGLGPMGLFHIPVLKSIGVRTVICSDPREDRRNIAKKLGATVIVDPFTEDLPGIVKEATQSNGVEQAYVTCGGRYQSQGVIDALNMLKKGGRVNSFASLYDGADPVIDINYLHYNHLSLIGTVGFQTSHVERTFEILKAYEDDFRMLMEPILPFSEILSGVDAALSQTALKVGIDF